MGAAQLICAPIAAWAQKHLPVRALLFFGFALFAAGLFTNATMTYATDQNELFCHRSYAVAVLFCLLPATALALEGLPTDRVSNASGLFNLMRNLGGAIAIALIDTILEQRVTTHSQELSERLRSADPDVFHEIGFSGSFTGSHFPETLASYIDLLIHRAALVVSFNEAWLMLGVAFTIAACLALLPQKALQSSDLAQT